MEVKILELKTHHAFSAGEMDEGISTTGIDEYELAATDLSPYNVLAITYFADQENLYKNKKIIEDFLNQGKVVIFCGHLFRSWLPGCSYFMPKKIDNYLDYMVKTVEGAPLFDGVDVEDMVFNKGISGFFARGYYYPPKKAEICLTFTDGKVISYIDRETTKGTIIVHGGRYLLGYKDMKKSTDKISKQTLSLLQKEIERGKILCEK